MNFNALESEERLNTPLKRVGNRARWGLRCAAADVKLGRDDELSVSVGKSSILRTFSKPTVCRDQRIADCVRCDLWY